MDCPKTSLKILACVRTTPAPSRSEFCAVLLRSSFPLVSPSLGSLLAVFCVLDLRCIFRAKVSFRVGDESSLMQVWFHCNLWRSRARNPTTRDRKEILDMGCGGEVMG